MKNIILSSSFIQYWNGKRYLKKCHPNKDYLIWKFQPFSVETEDENCLKEIPAKPKKEGLINHISFLIKLIALSLKYRGKVNILVVGEISARFMRLIVIIINSKKIVAVDDGLKSVITIPRYKYYFPKIFKIRDEVLKKSKFYTRYKVTNSEVEILYFHELEKKLNKNGKIIDEIWFIGQPLVELNLLSHGKVFGFIEEIFSSGVQIKYFMHRKEFLVKELSEKYQNVSLIQNDIPFEKYLSNTNKIPKEIISFYSTAFYHAYLMCKNKTVFKAKYLDINSDTDKVYEYFQTQNIKIIS